MPAKTRIEVRKKNIQVIDNDDVIESHIGDPLNYIKDFISRYKVAPVNEILPRFCGGLAGYFGYDTIRYIEPRLGLSKSSQKIADPNVPDILLMLTEELAVFDNLTGTLFLIVYADPPLKDSYSSANERLDQLLLMLANNLITSEQKKIGVEKSH